MDDFEFLLSSKHLHLCQTPKHFIDRFEMSYPGTTLKGDEIRLIRLLPGQWLDEIHCILFEVHLNDNPQYEALSYVWGSASVKRIIRLNSQPHATTVNLESALRHLRHSRQELVLWVDALCINQMNKDERTHQVNIMGQIYTFCKSVVIYLGDDLGHTGRSKTAPPLIHFFNDERDLPRIQDFNQHFTADDASVSPGIDREINALTVFSLIRILAQDQHFLDVPLFAKKLQEQGSDTKRMLLFEALRQFMHPPWTPWWSRIWVVQEIALPKSVTIMYGTVSAPWSMLARAVSNFINHSRSCCFQSMIIPRDQANVLLDFTQRILDITNLRLEHRDTKLFHSSMDNTSLLPLLRRFRNRKSTDPRDKIYALLALARSAELVPDYTLSEQEVFRRATLEVIYASKSLSVLSTELGRKFRSDLPTWVPDWGAPGTYMDTTRADAIKLYRIDTGIADQSTVRSVEAQVLEVEGVSIDRIAEVGEVMWGDSIESSKNTIWSWWKALWKSKIDILNPKLNFWRLLCADVIFFESEVARMRRIAHISHVSQGVHTLRRAEVNDETTFLSWALTAPRSPFQELNASFPTVDKLNLLFTKLLVKYPKAQGSFQADVLPLLLEEIKIHETQHRDAPFKSMTIFEDGSLSSDYVIREFLEHTYEYYLQEELGLEGAVMWNEKKLPLFLNMTENRRLITEKIDDGYNLNLTSSQQEITAMDNAITSATSSRRLLITQNGHICLGPADTRISDVIFYLKGGKTPFVLRDEEGTTTNRHLVGDCYIQGMMDLAGDVFPKARLEVIKLV